jgi:plasmid stabilization system protein ParE
LAEQYKVKLMSRALRDLDGIYKYIAETLLEPGTALALVAEIESEILSLEHFPNRCAPRREGAYAGKGYRQLFVKNYTVIFRVDEARETVIVTTVQYSASQF